MNTISLVHRLAEEAGFDTQFAWARRITRVDHALSNGYSIVGEYVDQHEPYCATPGERKLFLVCDGHATKRYALIEMEYSGYVFPLYGANGNTVQTVADHQLWAKSLHAAIDDWMAGPHPQVEDYGMALVVANDPAAIRQAVLEAAMKRLGGNS